jgi:hypothetical protein
MDSMRFLFSLWLPHASPERARIHRPRHLLGAQTCEPERTSQNLRLKRDIQRLARMKEMYLRKRMGKRKDVHSDIAGLFGQPIGSGTFGLDTLGTVAGRGDGVDGTPGSCRRKKRVIHTKSVNRAPSSSITSHENAYRSNISSSSIPFAESHTTWATPSPRSLPPLHRPSQCPARSGRNNPGHPGIWRTQRYTYTYTSSRTKTEISNQVSFPHSP